MRRAIARIIGATAAATLLLGGGAAFADTQPANLGAVNDFGIGDRGQEEGEPHCHTVVAAEGNEGFGAIIAGTAHKAHVETGLRTDSFAGVPCPN